MFINIFTAPKTEHSQQHFKSTALLLKNIRLTELYEIASLSSQNDLHKQFTAHEKSRSEELRKLINAHLPALQYAPSELSLRYELIIKLAKEARNAIQKKTTSLSKIEAMVVIHELEEENKKQVRFNTCDFSSSNEVRGWINFLIQNLTVGEAIEHLSFKAVNIDYFSNSFQHYINLKDLHPYKITFIKHGISRFEQCQAKINYEFKKVGKSILLDSLNNEYKKFIAFEKLLEKIFDSRNPEIISESIIYIKNIGIETNNSFLMINLYMHPQRTEIEKKLRSFIKKTQRKKARKKSNNENYRCSVYVTKGILEFLGSHSNSKKSKATILRSLVNDFLNANANDQSRLFNEVVIYEKTEHSHQKTDFTIPKKTHKQLTKIAKKNNITIQDLINSLVEDALIKNPYSLLVSREEITNAKTFTQIFGFVGPDLV